MKASLELAKSFEQCGDYVSALTSYQKCYAQEPQNQDVVLGIAQCALYLDQPQFALEFFVRLLILNHDHPWGYLGRATVLFEYGQTQRALSDVASAIKLDAPASDLRVDCASLLNAYGYTREALAALKPIRAQCFDHNDFRCAWAFALLAQNRCDDPDLIYILKDFQNHLEADPFYALCWIIFDYKRAIQTARARLNDFLERYPDLAEDAKILLGES